MLVVSQIFLTIAHMIIFISQMDLQKQVQQSKKLFIYMNDIIKKKGTNEIVTYSITTGQGIYAKFSCTCSQCTCQSLQTKP